MYIKIYYSLPVENGDTALQHVQIELEETVTELAGSPAVIALSQQHNWAIVQAGNFQEIEPYQVGMLEEGLLNSLDNPEETDL